MRAGSRSGAELTYLRTTLTDVMAELREPRDRSQPIA